MIPGIQHFRFCRRRWALTHIEQQWVENVYTVTDELIHKNTHDPFLMEDQKDVLITRVLPAPSRMIGASGECDVAKSHRGEDGVHFHGHRGLYSIFPIEYKKGKPKTSEKDVPQPAAQTTCLEETFSAVTSEAAVFYGEIRHHEIIETTDDLRNRIRDMFREMHQYYERRHTPKVKWSKGYNGCSLKDICLSKLGKTMSVGGHIKLALEEEG